METDRESGGFDVLRLCAFMQLTRLAPRIEQVEVLRENKILVGGAGALNLICVSALPGNQSQGKRIRQPSTKFQNVTRSFC